MDAYPSFKELRVKEKEGKDYIIKQRIRNSPLAIIAPHGGWIEPGTSEIADHIAGEEHSFYTFEGIKSKLNFRLHITSVNFDEPSCIEIIKYSRIALTIHGFSQDYDVVYIGGLHTQMIDAVRINLNEAGFQTEYSPKAYLAGKSLKNICNMGILGRGVQIEISLTLRKKMFRDMLRKGGTERTELFYRFVQALRNSLLKIS